MPHAQLPSSPAADADLAPRWWRAMWRASLKQHLKRAAAIATGVVVFGSGVSIYLSEMGVRFKDGDAAREIFFYPFTVQMRSDVTRNAAGELHGLRREWHRSGAPWVEGAYANGVRTGTWREYFSNGALRFEGTYKGDALDGTETWYYANGNKEWEVGRVGGRRDGEERWWHDNGELRRIGHYRGGERHGTFSVYDENGAVAFTGEYKDGESVSGPRID